MTLETLTLGLFIKFCVVLFGTLFVVGLAFVLVIVFMDKGLDIILDRGDKRKRGRR